MVQIKEIMTKDVTISSKDKLLSSLVKTMAAKNISCVMITENKKPIGIVTERDLIKKIVLKGKTTKNLKVKDIMTSNLITLPETASIIEASHTMKRYTIRHLPITKEGELKGVVTQTDLAREAGAIEVKNKRFMTYQNIQSLVIIIFFAFFGAYLVYLFLFIK